MATMEEILKRLKSKARPDQVAEMAKYGMTAEQRLGASIGDIMEIAKESGKDHQLAIDLWKTGIPEARVLAAMVDEPDKLTEDQMDDWVKDFNSWDVCDQVCGRLFDKHPRARVKIHSWSEREEEFVKRAAFALIACLAVHDKDADDESFVELLPVIERGATDERNYVKKAVNWALRSIGKRNPNLNQAAIKAAEEIQRINAKAARWIASDAIRELESEAVQQRLRK
ncbi:MAG: DNA alkylation repair protein [Fidelibacterota bacterium]|nr:MAG: DNA alkylation repair protein [Candidatus Neomarinimicrobiota bacterium]